MFKISFKQLKKKYLYKEINLNLLLLKPCKAFEVINEQVSDYHSAL